MGSQRLRTLQESPWAPFAAEGLSARVLSGSFYRCRLNRVHQAAFVNPSKINEHLAEPQHRESGYRLSTENGQEKEDLSLESSKERAPNPPRARAALPLPAFLLLSATKKDKYFKLSGFISNEPGYFSLTVMIRCEGTDKKNVHHLARY